MDVFNVRFTFFNQTWDVPFWPLELVVHAIMLVNYYDHLADFLEARRVFNNLAINPRPIHWKASLARALAFLLIAYHTLLCLLILILFYVMGVNPYRGYVLLFRLIVFIFNSCLFLALVITSEAGFTEAFDGPDKMDVWDKEKGE